VISRRSTFHEGARSGISSSRAGWEIVGKKRLAAWLRAAMSFSGRSGCWSILCGRDDAAAIVKSASAGMKIRTGADCDKSLRRWRFL
jgi:hypothetical protein